MCQHWVEQAPHWEWWPVPLDRGSAAHYLCRGVVLFGTDWTESRGRVLLVVNQLLVTFFVLYMAAVWIILSARSAKL